MNEEVALYFPYSRVPENEWFTKILLYWDHAESIVPKEHPSRNEPYQKELVRAGLLRQIEPEDVLDDMNSEFVPRLLNALDQRPVHYEYAHMEPVYGSKLPQDLLKELKDRSLAEPEPSTSGLWRVDVETADAYMAYLAAAVSVKRPGTSPVTNHEEALAMLNLPRPETTRQELTKMRYALISAALPAPSRTVPPAELRAFKDKNEDALRRCRSALDEELVKIAEIHDPELKRVQEGAAIDRIQGDVATLVSQMSKRRWPTMTSLSIAGVGIAAEIAEHVTVHAPTRWSAWLLITAALAQVGPMAADAFAKGREGGWDRNAPFAYAVLARRA